MNDDAMRVHEGGRGAYGADLGSDFLLCPDHVIAQCAVDLKPRVLFISIELFVTEKTLNGEEKCTPHAWKVFWFDTISNMLCAKIHQDFSKQFNIWSEHTQSFVNHLDEVGGVLRESFILAQLFDFCVFAEAKDYLGIWFKRE